MNNRVIAGIGLLAVLVAGVVFWNNQNKQPVAITPVVGEKITVGATFYPLAYLAEQIGGDLVQVINATPVGVEPHDYEPSPRELIKLQQAKVFLINGAGLDPWAEKAAADWKSKGQTVLVMSDTVTVLPPAEEHGGHEDEDAHNHGAFDPHFWLDPVRARQMSGVIRDALIAADPVNSDAYRTNTINLLQRLSDLHTAFEQGLAQCQSRTVVAAHDAYNYLAKRYNLEMHAIAGLSPDAEPSARRLAELTDLVKTEGISTIFFETLTSRQLADTLAREAGVKTAVLNPIEGLTAAEVSAGKNYDILMRENLAQLRLALVCQ